MTNQSNLIIPGKKKPYVMAHRGNNVLCPENTIASFRQAILDGADILETDLQLSKDDQFMCIHDGSIDRTTNGTGLISDYTGEELKTFSAFYGKKAFMEEKIPLLSELASILPPDVALALELKSDRFLEDVVCQKLIDLLSQTEIRNRTFVISFSKARVQTLHRLANDIPAGLITMSGFSPDPDMQIIGPFWPLILLNPFYIKKVRKNNQIVCPLDPTPDKRLWIYKKMKVDAILTDNPQKTCQLIEKYE
ncbi:MAG: glycerophosphodiester phosphodiesterase family protein [Anaerolineaceae bacterium]|nr:glycerophosphodiester phosphodiesterase family protein [Anaerolineaceae bacterium]